MAREWQQKAPLLELELGLGLGGREHSTDSRFVTSTAPRICLGTSKLPLYSLYHMTSEHKHY